VSSDAIPFILATPHHSMVWAGSLALPAPAASGDADQILIRQYEAALANLEQMIQQTTDLLQTFDAQHREMQVQHRALVGGRTHGSIP
jgi:hypothetical protein